MIFFGLDVAVDWCGGQDVRLKFGGRDQLDTFVSGRGLRDTLRATGESIF